MSKKTTKTTNVPNKNLSKPKNQKNKKYSFEDIAELVEKQGVQEDLILAALKDRESDDVLTETDENKDTLLILALKHSYYKAALLIADITPYDALMYQNKSGNTALHWAARTDNAIAVINAMFKKLYYSQKLQLIKTNNGQNETALHFAAKYNALEVVKMLIARDPKLIEAVNKDKETALHFAARHNDKQVIEALIKHFTPDDEASSKQARKTKGDLLKLLHKKNTQGKTALDLAKKDSEIWTILSKLMKKALVSLDDSSDEEDSVKDYKVVQKLENFIERINILPQSLKEIRDNETMVLSFITHAFGIYLFYSPLVQTKYYSLKKDKLKFSAEEIDSFCTSEYPVRKILQETNFTPDDWVDFLAQLRLHNRSEKRKLKNWDSKKTLDKHESLKWHNAEIGKFGFRQETDKKFILRDETVDYNRKTILPYKDIPNFLGSEVLSVFLKDNEIPVSYMVNHNKPEDAKKIAKFFYHVFGCETIKNPAAFIHTKMVLDLIKAEKLTWENALVDRKLPMTMKDAIRASSVMNSSYTDFMPHQYSYDHDYKDLSYSRETRDKHKSYMSRLLQKEIAITEKWLKWKLGESVSQYLIEKCSLVQQNPDDGKSEASDTPSDDSKDQVSISDPEVVNVIWGLLEEACKDWYPGVLGELGG